MCFGHVPIAVRQGRQRRDVVAERVEQHGRFKAGQGKFQSLAVASRRVADASFNSRYVALPFAIFFRISLGNFVFSI